MYLVGRLDVYSIPTHWKDHILQTEKNANEITDVLDLSPSDAN